MSNPIVLPNGVYVYSDENGNTLALQDYPIFDEENSKEIIGYETVGVGPEELASYLKK